jgi:hypothetical protein
VVQLRKSHRHGEWFDAALIHRSDNWALLKIAKQNITQVLYY